MDSLKSFLSKRKKKNLPGHNLFSFGKSFSWIKKVSIYRPFSIRSHVVYS